MDAALLPCCMAAVSRAAAAARLDDGCGCPLCMNPDTATADLLPHSALCAAAREFARIRDHRPAAGQAQPSSARGGGGVRNRRIKRRRVGAVGSG